MGVPSFALIALVPSLYSYKKTVLEPEIANKLCGAEIVRPQFHPYPPITVIMMIGLRAMVAVVAYGLCFIPNFNVCGLSAFAEYILLAVTDMDQLAAASKGKRWEH